MKHHFYSNKSCFLDLSDEILLFICRYLSLSDILSKPEISFHTHYYTNVRIGSMPLNQFNSILKLFSNSFRPSSLILNNEQVPNIINRFVNQHDSNTLKSIFNHLKSLTLINPTTIDLELFESYHTNLTQLQSLYIINRKINDSEHLDCVWPSHSSIVELLFEKQINSLDKLLIQPINGISLFQSLTPNLYISYINIYLQTIDDLFILLNGILPNIKIMIVRLCEKRLLKYRHFQCQKLCHQLTEFSLCEYSIGMIMDDIKWILNFMPNVNKLTLSIRDTLDPLFCHGPNFEKILTEFLPNLHQFEYTMTHQITENTILQDFIRWPMNFTNYENNQWIHIYSLPWPSSRDDQRELPFLTDGSYLTIKSDIKISEYMKDIIITKSEQLSSLKRDYPRVRQLTTCLSIDIKLPLCISKLILGKETNESSIHSLIQPSINHLIIKRRLYYVEELSNYARQFPHVKYLELLFPIEKSSFINCLKTLFSFNTEQKQRCYWPELIHFSTYVTFRQFEPMYQSTILHLWLIQNTDLKYVSSSFYANPYRSLFSIWL